MFDTILGKILNIDLYTAIPAVVVCGAIISLSLPAYNKFSYDANINYVKSIEKNIEDSLIQIKDSDLNEINGFNIYKNEKKLPVGKNGDITNAEDCLNIFEALTGGNLNISIGRPVIDEITEYEFLTNYENNTCILYYSDKNNVLYKNSYFTHTIEYNHLNSEKNIILKEKSFKF